MFASAFILTVLACSPNGLVCRPTVTETQYTSLQDCRAAISSTEDAVRSTFPADTRFVFRGACAASEQAKNSGIAWAVSASGELLTSFDRLPAGSGVATAAGADQKIDDTITASIGKVAADETELSFDTERMPAREPVLRGDRPTTEEWHASRQDEPLLYEMAAR